MATGLDDPKSKAFQQKPSDVRDFPRVQDTPVAKSEPVNIFITGDANQIQARELFNLQASGGRSDGLVSGTLQSEIAKTRAEEKKKKEDEENNYPLALAIDELLDEIEALQDELADELDNAAKFADQYAGLSAQAIAADEALSNTNARIIRIEETLRQQTLRSSQYAETYEQAVRTAALADENVRSASDELTYQEHRALAAGLITLPIVEKSDGYMGTGYHIVMRDEKGFYLQTGQGRRVDITDKQQLTEIEQQLANGGKTGDQEPAIAAGYEAASFGFAKALHDSNVATIAKNDAAQNLQRNLENTEQSENELQSLREKAKQYETEKTAFLEKAEKAKIELKESLDKVKEKRSEIEKLAEKAGVSVEDLLAKGDLKGKDAAAVERYRAVMEKNSELTEKLSVLERQISQTDAKLEQNATLTKSFEAYHNEFLPQQRALLADPEFSQAIASAKLGLTPVEDVRQLLNQKSPGFEDTFKKTFGVDMFTQKPDGSLDVRKDILQASLTDRDQLETLKNLFLEKAETEKQIAATAALQSKVEGGKQALESAAQGNLDISHKEVVLKSRGAQPPVIAEPGLRGLFNAFTSEGFAKTYVANMDVVKDAEGNAVYLDEEEKLYTVLQDEESGQHVRKYYDEDQTTEIMAGYRNAKGEARLFASESALYKDPTRDQKTVFKLTAGDVLTVCDGASCRLADKNAVNVEKLKAIDTKIEQLTSQTSADEEQAIDGADSKNAAQAPAPKPDAGLDAIAKHKNDIATVLANSGGTMDEAALTVLAVSYGIPATHIDQLKASLTAMDPNFKITQPAQHVAAAADAKPVVFGGPGVFRPIAETAPSAPVIEGYNTLSTQAGADPGGPSSKLAFASAAAGTKPQTPDDPAFKLQHQPTAAPSIMSPAA